MNATDFLNDIPTTIARAAHYCTSFEPEKRGDQERQGYAQTLAQDFEQLSKLADTDEKRATLAEEFARYREGFRRRTVVQLVAKSRCMSSMITGPSNFPTRRNEKRNATERKRVTELLDFRERALKAIRRTLCPELRPIMSGDSDATQRLHEKIAEAEKLQATMKAANAIIRRAPKYEMTSDKLSALVEIGITQRQAHELCTKDFCGRYGFPDYELTNNNANIKRMKARLAQVSAAQSKPDLTIQGEVARFEECPGENRVRLYFPGKPDEAIRTKLKSCGFRWTPSLGCWQAYRNYRSIEVARTVAAVPA